MRPLPCFDTTSSTTVVRTFVAFAAVSRACVSQTCKQDSRSRISSKPAFAKKLSATLLDRTRYGVYARNISRSIFSCPVCDPLAGFPEFNLHWAHDHGEPGQSATTKKHRTKALVTRTWAMEKQPEARRLRGMKGIVCT